MNNIEYSIKNYTITPGGRLIKDGPFSGEDFLNKHLKPLYLEAFEKGCKLIINLDGTYGYPSSFLEESFGGLAREFGERNIKQVLKIISEEDIAEIERIYRYIKDAGK